MKDIGQVLCFARPIFVSLQEAKGVDPEILLAELASDEGGVTEVGGEGRQEDAVGEGAGGEVGKGCAPGGDAVWLGPWQWERAVKGHKSEGLVWDLVMI